MKAKINALREKLNEYLNGLVISDYITRKDQTATIKDFNKWSKTAAEGDSYYYDDLKLTI